jgi:hypothetical protein
MLRILTPVGCVLAVAVLLAGCGGSNNTGNAGSATAGSSGRANAGLKMAQCMRANGVPSFPDPGSNGGPIAIAGGGSSGTATVGGVSVARSTLQAAFQKCQKDLPKGPPLTSAQIARLRQGALKMAHCMRAHGVTNFPDPQISTGPGGRGIGIRIGVGPNGAAGDTACKTPGPAFTRSPAFQSAQKICMPLMGKAFGKRPAP